MKNLSLIIMIFAVIVFSSCQKDGDGTPVVINPNAAMSCKIDGANWTAFTRITTNTAGTFVINGSALSSDALNITIIGESVGSYTLGTMQYNFSASYSPVATNPDSVYTAVNGTVTLTEVNTSTKKISGSFQFNAINVLNNNLNRAITEGVFTSLSYN
ncbi:MAG: hypothetical protein CVU11_05885 [Bacteroidetes bacterium HGW-Bacteroidetes-6]|nr:MAG: hypothetical protein CVU11_05885 [Bacteroidetes bacterium HGW-Bacteroidetes-6]